MFLVINTPGNVVQTSKWAVDPRRNFNAKQEAKSQIAVIELSPKGDELGLNELRELFDKGVFDGPSMWKA